jgi:arylsulfatase
MGEIISESIEYEPGIHFPDVIGRTLDRFSPAWPIPTRARGGAQNVIFFILDDVGYGQMLVFGGSAKHPTWNG